MKKWIKFLILDALLLVLIGCEYREQVKRDEQVNDREVMESVAQEEEMNQDTKKKIAITFDDGPSSSFTVQLLDGLRERNVQATFFLLGQNIGKYPDIVRTMYEDGHLIANHTYSHMELTSENGAAYVEEIEKTNALITALTGEDTDFVRPPYGVWDKRYEEELDMIPVFWTIDPQDWCTFDVDTIVERVVKRAEEDAIILLHDCYQSSVDAALEIVDILQAEGYEFVTVDELLME